jgi:replicative DNA helicase
VTQIPPHSVEAEHALLGSVLLNPRLLDDLAGRVAPEDCYLPGSQTVLAACYALHERGTAPNVLTVTHELASARKLSTVGWEGYGGAAFVAHLSDRVPSSGGWESAARIVAELAARRRLMAAAGEIGIKAQRLDTPAAQVLDEAEAAVLAVSRSVDRRPIASMDDGLAEAFDAIAAASACGGMTGLATGLHALDRMTGGLQASDLILLAGRPGAGKSALGVQIAARSASVGIPALVFSLEMPRVQIFQRLLSSEGRVDQRKLRTATLSGDEYDRIESAGGLLKGKPLFVDDTGALPLMELRAKARRMVADHGVKLVVVDYLQLVRAPASKGASREQEIATISRGLKAIAKELDVPVLALAQLSRKAEDRPDKRPHLADLRESGSLEQDADVVLFVFREEMYSDDASKRGLAEIIVGKQRNGPVGTVEARFVAEHTRFESLHAEQEAA